MAKEAYSFGYQAYMLIYSNDILYHRNGEVVDSKKLDINKHTDGFYEPGNTKLPVKDEPYQILPIQAFSVTYALNTIPEATVSLGLGYRIDSDYLKEGDQTVASLNFNWVDTKPRVKIKISMICYSSGGGGSLIYNHDTIFNGYIQSMNVDNSTESYSATVMLTHWLNDLHSGCAIGSMVHGRSAHDIAWPALYKPLKLGANNRIDTDASLFNLWQECNIEDEPAEVTKYDSMDGTSCIVRDFIKPFFALFAKHTTDFTGMPGIGVPSQNNFSFEAISKLLTIDKTTEKFKNGPVFCSKYGIQPVVWRAEMRELMQSALQNIYLNQTVNAVLGYTLWDKITEMCGQFGLTIIPGVNEFYIQPFTSCARGVDKDGLCDHTKSIELREVLSVTLSVRNSLPVKACLIPYVFPYNNTIYQEVADLEEEYSESFNDENVSNAELDDIQADIDDIRPGNGGWAMYPKYTLKEGEDCLAPGKLLIKSPPHWLTTNVLEYLPIDGVLADLMDVPVDYGPDGEASTYTASDFDDLNQERYDARIKVEADAQKERKELIKDNFTALFKAYHRLAKAFYYSELFANQTLTITMPVTLGIAPGSVIYINKASMTSGAATGRSAGFYNDYYDWGSQAFIGTVRAVNIRMDSNAKQAFTQLTVGSVRTAIQDSPGTGFESTVDDSFSDSGDGAYSTDYHPYYDHLFHYTKLVDAPDYLDIILRAENAKNS